MGVGWGLFYIKRDVTTKCNAGYWLNHRFFKMCFTVHFWDNWGNLYMGICVLENIIVFLLHFFGEIMVLWLCGRMFLEDVFKYLGWYLQLSNSSGQQTIGRKERNGSLTSLNVHYFILLTVKYMIILNNEKKKEILKKLKTNWNKWT